MSPNVWTPHMTVAAVVERDQEFLLVEERADGERVLNQPAGHLEPGERLIDAVVREVLEEAAAHFVPEHVIGVYRWPNPQTGETHVRVAFTGHLAGVEPERELDQPIITTHWMAYEHLREESARLRSPLVLACLDDYRQGRRFPLDLLREFE